MRPILAWIAAAGPAGNFQFGPARRQPWIVQAVFDLAQLPFPFARFALSRTDGMAVGSVAQQEHRKKWQPPPLTVSNGGDNGLERF
jgi:hypothetical protein